MGNDTNREPDAAAGDAAAVDSGGRVEMVDNTLPGLPARQAVERVGPQVVEIATAHNVAQARQAEAVIREAVGVADELKKVVKERGWAKSFGGSEHLTIEAWQFIGRFFAVTVKVCEIQFVEFGSDTGFKAVAEAIHADTGAVLSRAEALCMTDEERWRERAKFEWRGRYPNKERVRVGTEPVTHRERASMAQTRACSKALSNLFRSVASMAGYKATPADDLPESDTDDGAPLPEAPPEFAQPPQTQPPPENKAKPQPRISVDQAQDMRSLALELHGNRAASITGEVLQKFGYRVTSEVLAKDYKAVMAALEKTRR